MPDNKEKFDISDILNSFTLPEPGEHQIKSAEKRVWNNIAYRIDQQLEKEGVIPSKIPFWQKNMKFFVAASLIMFLAATGVTGGFFYYTSLKKADNSTAEVVPTEEAATVQNIRELAASRFAELNGVSFDEFKAVIKETEAKPENPTPTDVLDTSKAEKLSQIDENQTVYFSEQELDLIDIKSPIEVPGYGVVETSLVDRSKPLLIKNWYSVSYNKTTLEQEDKLILMRLDTPDYFVEYHGGKYAIQAKYKEKKVIIAGLSKDGLVATNPEIQVMKYVLENGNAEDAKIEELDGKEYIVFTVPKSETDSGKFFKKYFMDKDTFTLYLTEEYSEGEKISSIKNVNREQKKDVDPSKEINFKELEASKISLKIVKDYEPFVREYYKNLPTFSEFTDQYPLVVLKDTKSSEINLSKIIIKDQPELTEYEKLAESKEFNPDFKKNNILAQYSQKDAGLEFILSKDIEEIKDKKTQENKNIKVKIDGKEFNAVLTILIIPEDSPTPTPTPEKNNNAILQIDLDNDLWLKVTTTEEGRVKFEEGMEFIKISSDEAEKLDEKKVLGVEVTHTVSETPTSTTIPKPTKKKD